MNSRRATIIFMTLGLCSIVSFCTRRAEKSGTLRGALGAEPPTLDPYVADTGVSIFVLKQVQTTLFRLNAYMDVVPGDAESFIWAKNGRELRITLREGLKWSDGVALRACHYRDAFMHVLSPSVAAPLADLFYDIRGAQDFKKGLINPSQFKSVECVDSNRQIVFSLLRPFSFKIFYALTFVTSSPFRKERFEVLKENWLLGNDAYPPISTGAYFVKEWVHDQRITLVSRSSQGDAALSEDRIARISKIELPIVRDPLAAFHLYESGDLDFLEEIPTSILPTIGARADVVKSVYPTTYFVGFSFKANAVLKDPRVRRALSFSAGQEDVPQLLKGGEVEARSWIYPQLLPERHRARSSLHRLSLARGLLDEAGFQDRKNFPRLKLQYNGGERHQVLMERLAYKWKTDLGIQVDLQPIEWKVHVAQLKTSAPDLFRYAWTAVYPDPLFFLELFESSSLNNFGAWKNSEYDAVVEKLRSIPLAQRDEKFYKLIHRAEEILVEVDPAIIPIYHYVRNALVRPYMKNLSWDLSGVSLFKDVYFEKR